MPLELVCLLHYLCRDQSCKSNSFPDPPTQKPEGYEFRVNNLATLAADPGQNSSVDTSDLQESSSLLDDEGSPPTSPQDTSEDEARLAPRSPPQEVGVPAQQTSPTLVESIVPRPLSAQTLPRYTQYRDKEMLVEILRSLNACSGILPAHEMSVTQLDKMHETLALSILATAKDPVTTITAGGWQQYLRVAFMALTAVYARKISNLRRALTLFDPRRDDGNLLMAALFLAIRNGANDFVKLLLETFGRSQGRLICRVQDFLAPAAFERVEDGSPMSSPWMPSVPRGHLLNREPDQQAATVILNGLYKTARDQNYTEQGPICIQSLSTTALSQRITALVSLVLCSRNAVVLLTTDAQSQHGIENGFDICQVFRFAGVDVEYIPSGTPHINVDDLLSEGPLSQEAYRKPTGGANAGVEFSNMGQRG